eukprot:PhF_6_TR10724/c0_g1_i1/m.17281
MWFLSCISTATHQVVWLFVSGTQGYVPEAGVTRCKSVLFVAWWISGAEGGPDRIPLCGHRLRADLVCGSGMVMLPVRASFASLSTYGHGSVDVGCACTHLALMFRGVSVKRWVLFCACGTIRQCKSPDRPSARVRSRGVGC